jgi:paraquat-inducible protein A
MPQFLKFANLALLVLFPLAWFAPLLRAGLLPFFDLAEISVISGLQALWEKDVSLALLVTFFAIFAPYLKTIGLALMQFRLLSPRAAPALHILGKLAMADIFLIAIYIIVIKGIGLARVETAWGLYLFSACVLASLAISIAGTPRPGKIKPAVTQGA